MNSEPKYVAPTPLSVILLQDLYQKADELSVICHGIAYKDTDEFLWAAGKMENSKAIPAYTSIRNIPGYCKPVCKEDLGLSVKNYPSLQGFSICLDTYSSADGYMTASFNRKAKGNILRCLRRLEKCFDISYDCYHGAIEEDRCNSLLEQLHEMIVARFRERQESSATLDHWEQIKSTLYPWILSKKASLYVISQAGIPICISISYHYGSTLFYYVTSYDIDYSKFSLGNLMIYKQLEWCFKVGGYRYLEMGWGYMDYKRRWCNTTHNFQHYIIYPGGSFKGRIHSLIKGNRTAFVTYLQDKPIYKLYHRLKAARKKKAAGGSVSVDTYHLVDLDISAAPGDLTPVSVSGSPDIPMKQLYNDFLYLTEEYYMDVCFLEDKSSGTLYLKGKRHLSQLVK